MAELAPLVGRERIVAHARGLLDAEGGGIVLVGEGGIGKSRIAAEVLRLGSEHGYATASTVGTLAAAAIPLGALSHLLPDLTTTAGNVLMAAQAALAERAGERRLMLSVDDAHLLDNHSAALVFQLALAMPSFLVATIRSGEAVPDAVVALWKEGHAERVDVGPLDDRSIEAIASHVLGGPIDSTIGQAVVERADGNPMVARELCLAGLDSGAVERRDGRWRLVGQLGLSTRLMELVAARVEDLDDAERHALNVIAHGEPLSMRIAGKLVSSEALIGLERRGLVVLQEEGRRRDLWLAHPIYAEVVRASVGRLLSGSLKATLAATTRAAGMRRRDDRLRVATWELEAGRGDVDLLRAVAQETYQARDMAGTARLAAGAWDIRPDATIGHILGIAIGFMGHQEEADAILAAATELATNEEEYARLVLAHSSVLSAGLGMPDAAIALLAAADERVIGDDTRAALRAQRAHLLAFHGDVVEALTLAEPLVGDGHGVATPVAAMAALISYLMNGAYERCIALVEQLAPEHRRMWAAGAVMIPPEILELQADGARVAMGQLDAVAPPEVRGPGRATAGPVNRPAAVLRAFHAARAALLRGKPVQAEGIISGIAPVPSDPLASSLEALTAVAAALTGQPDVASAALDRAEEAMQRESRTFNPVIAEAHLWTLLAEGRPNDARRVTVQAIEGSIVAKRWGIALALAHDLGRVGSASEAVGILAQIEGAVDGPLAAARRIHIEALDRGDQDGLEEASQAFAALGADLLAAEAAADAGRAARREGKARRATRLFQRAAALMATCEGARTPALVMPLELTPLTPREREVATLAATGLASDELADRLFLSVRTIDNHLQHIYQKLGIGSRTELAAAMRDGDR
jgi:DNA-binding CsgD family transcriptional regulator